MNRVNSASYPNSIEEVIYQSGQFTPAMTGWLDNVRVSAGYTQGSDAGGRRCPCGSESRRELSVFRSGWLWNADRCPFLSLVISIIRTIY